MKNFWTDIPEDCKKAISELKRMKVFKLIARDYEETFSDVWWLVLHEVDMYDEGEFCKEASRSIFGEGDPQAMDLKQAKAADRWLIRYQDLNNKYRAKEYYSEDYFKCHSGWDGEYYYDGQF